MEEKLNKILTYLIILTIVLFVSYIVYIYIKTPVNEEHFPIKITELAGKDVVEWENYVKEIKPTKLIVYVNHYEKSETPQLITDSEKINEVLDIILNLEATSLADRFRSTATRVIYYFEDDSGKSMAFTFQEDLFKLENGRYYVDNINVLNQVKDINLYK